MEELVTNIIQCGMKSIINASETMEQLFCGIVKQFFHIFLSKWLLIHAAFNLSYTNKRGPGVLWHLDMLLYEKVREDTSYFVWEWTLINCRTWFDIVTLHFIFAMLIEFTCESQNIRIKKNVYFLKFRCTYPKRLPWWRSSTLGHKKIWQPPGITTIKSALRMSTFLLLCRNELK